MIQSPNKPFYIKLSHTLLSITLIALIIYFGREILLPIFFGVLLAILLMPVANWFIKKGLPNIFSLLLAVFLAFILIIIVLYFLSTQLGDFMNDLPKIKQQLNSHWQTVQLWITETFNFSKKEQQKVIKEATQDIKDSGTDALGNTVLSALNILTYVVLLPIYTFLIMCYRKLIRKFLIASFQEQYQENVEKVIIESKMIVNGYMTGLVIEVGIVAVLNAIAFLIVGIDYVIFLAILVALLNMIPYIGMVIGNVICMVITLTNSDNLTDILWVFVALFIVQLIDNNWITPFVVSSKVKINAFVSIVGVLIGAALAGVAGMFLSIPGVAILKVIFEKVDDLKPWGILFGENDD